MSVSSVLNYANLFIKKRLTRVFLFRLTFIPYVSSKLSKDTKMTSSAEASNFFIGEPSQEIFCYLHVVDDNIADKVTFDLLNSYPSIFVSEAVQGSLDLKMNSKVKLDIISGTLKNKVTEINYHVLNLQVSI